ncbi:hypothetical protein ACJ72_06485, partial [Emergomyces africanus]
MQRLTALRGAADILDSVHFEPETYFEMEVFNEESSTVEEKSIVEDTFHKIHTWIENQSVQSQP